MIAFVPVLPDLTSKHWAHADRRNPSLTVPTDAVIGTEPRYDFTFP